MEEDARFKSILLNQSLFKPVNKHVDVEAIYNDVDESEVPVDVEPGVRVLTRSLEAVFCTYFIVFIFKFLTYQYTVSGVLMVHSSEVTP